jgi:hypothetical protein
VAAAWRNSRRACCLLADLSLDHPIAHAHLRWSTAASFGKGKHVHPFDPDVERILEALHHGGARDHAGHVEANPGFDHGRRPRTPRRRRRRYPELTRGRLLLQLCSAAPPRPGSGSRWVRATTKRIARLRGTRGLRAGGSGIGQPDQDLLRDVVPSSVSHSRVSDEPSGRCGIASRRLFVRRGFDRADRAWVGRVDGLPREHCGEKMARGPFRRPPV